MRRVGIILMMGVAAVLLAGIGFWIMSSADTGNSELIEQLANDLFEPVCGCQQIHTPASDQLLAKGKRVVPELAAALSHHNPRVQYGAAMTLRRFGPEAKVAVPELIIALKAQSQRESVHAARMALEAIGPAAEKALLAELNAPDGANIEAASALLHMKLRRNEVIARLIELAAGTGNFSLAQLRAIEMLGSEVCWRDGDTRPMAVEPDAPGKPLLTAEEISAAAPVLLELIALPESQDWKSSVAAKATETLAVFGPAVLEDLYEILDGDDLYAKERACWTLGRMYNAVRNPDPQATQRAVVAMSKQVTSNDLSLKCAAFGALRSIGPPAAAEIAHLMTADDDWTKWQVVNYFNGFSHFNDFSLCTREQREKVLIELLPYRLELQHFMATLSGYSQSSVQSLLAALDEFEKSQQ